MPKSEIIHKASDFKYPAREERKLANLKYPKLRNFGFEYVYEIISILDNNPMEEVHKKSSLYYWDLCLLNKLGKLSESYIFLHTNYNRGIPDSFDKMSQIEFLNHFLFDYYAEIFYYHYFSARDNIGQILNIYYDLKIEENEVYFNKLIPLLTNVQVKTAITKFNDSTKVTSKYRNAFTHRFPLNYPDYRPNFKHENGHKKFSAGSGKYIKPSEFMFNIDESLQFLDDFMTELKKEIKPSR